MKRKRALSLILALCLALLPALSAAAAEEAEPIAAERVEITGLDVPVVGEPLDAEVAVGSGNCRVERITWTPAAETAEAGGSYAAAILVSPAEGFVFTEDTAVTVNGGSEGLTVALIAEEGAQQGWLRIECPALEPFTRIDAITVTGVVEPRAGETPTLDGLAAPAGANYAVQRGSGSFWSCGDGPDFSEMQIMAEGERFAAGRYYALAIGLDIRDGCVLAPPERLEATVNGAPADVAGEVLGSGLIIKYYGPLEDETPYVFPFADVEQSESNWYYLPVRYANQTGLIAGKSATAFEPDARMTYAEAIKLAVCMRTLHDGGDPGALKPSAAGPWYQSFVDLARDLGIPWEFPDYGAPATRADYVRIFYAALPAAEYAAINEIGDDAIPDVKTADLCAAEIYAFYRAGILVGSDAAGTFHPGDSIRRCEVAVIVQHMMDPATRRTVDLAP